MADSGKYAVAIGKIRSDATGDEYSEPEKGLVQHLMIAYFNGWIEWDNALLGLFFERAPVGLRGQAIDFLKTGFKSVNEKEDEDYKNVVKARITLYWRNRLNVVRKNPKQNFEEVVRFCRWVKDSPLEPEDTLSLLHETLVLTGGNLGRNVYIRGFLEGICKIAEGHELEAIKCLKMSTQDDKAWFYTSGKDRDNIKELLDDVLKLADNYPEVIEIRKEAKELADNFGRLRIYDFRDHYNQLIKNS